MHPPLKVLEDDPIGPRLRERHVGIVAIGGDRRDDLPAPTCSTWVPECGQTQGADAIVLDFPCDWEDSVLRVVLQHTELAQGWSSPLPSPSASSSRRVLYGYTDDKSSGLHYLLVARQLQELLDGTPHLAIGHTSIMRDAGASLTDTQGPGRLLASRDHLE